MGRAGAPPLAAPRQRGAPVGAGYFKGRVTELLAEAGVEIGGGRPWDIQVHRDRFYRRALGGSLGIGESYMDGDWDCQSLDEFVARVFRADLPSRIRPELRVALAHVTSALFNRWSRFAVRRKVAPHYDLGNDLFTRMLDKSTMAYTCGYWQGGAKTLEEAQEAKFDLICRKLTLEPGMRVLEIGCGWGSFAKYAAEGHGVHVHGVTLSQEQAELGMERCAGLPVELVVRDYRDVEGRFD
ncbi:MAG: class I SAM-dependent methyltransferase, partial [Acidobacteriota bacterium]|nr:class I SAM-dependent methyltransferase [Acidobacteriota bacterium]